MSKVTNIGSRIHSVERGNVVAGANEILDDAKGKKQNVINNEVDAELIRLDQSKQNNLTFDNTPTEGSDNPVKSGGVYAADNALSDAIDAILILIPSAATALNQLADKNFVNSSIATDTATFRGTSDTGLSEAQFLEWANGLTHDMNDYVFWQTIDEAGNTLFKRYKWNGTQWLYEYTLNNSSFTADQWAAITSGITTALVEKLVGLPTNAALQQALNSKQNALTFDNVPTENSINPVKSGGVYSAVKAEEDARQNLAQTVSEIGGDVSQIENVIPAGATAQNKLVENASMEAYVASIIQNITASFTLATADGHINLTLTQTNGQVATFTLTSSDIASAQALTALTGRVTTAEGNITSLTGRVSTNETDITNLQQLYNDLQQSKPVPVTALPETDQQQGVIYRLAGTTSYSDYMWNGSTWVLMATYNNAIDPRPKKASLNLVTSGGVFDNMGALDVSELNATENPHTLAKYVDLSAALAAIPTDYQKGGMSIKFVQSSDNKYVQCRLMLSEFTAAQFANPENWQGVDTEVTAGSKNFVESGAVKTALTKAGKLIDYQVNLWAQRYIDDNGALAYKSDTSVSLPILLHKGDTIICQTMTNGNSPIYKVTLPSLAFVGVVNGKYTLSKYYYTANEDCFVSVYGYNDPGIEVQLIRQYSSLDERIYETSKGLLKDTVALVADTDFTLIDSRIINNDGTVSYNSSYKITSPIHLNAGETLNVSAANNNEYVIWLTDSSASYYVGQLNRYSGTDLHNFTYYAHEECYIAICYNTSQPLTVTKDTYTIGIKQKDIVNELGTNEQKVPSQKLLRQNIGKQITTTEVTVNTMVSTAIDDNGNITIIYGYYVTNPILLKKGETINAHLKNADYNCLWKTNIGLTTFVALLGKTQGDDSSDNNYTATEDMYVVLCGRNGFELKITVETIDECISNNNDGFSPRYTKNITYKALFGQNIGSIRSDGTINTSEDTYRYTRPIHVKKGDTINAICITNGSPTLFKTDATGSSYTKLLWGIEESELTEHKFIFIEDCYVAILYRNAEGCTCYLTSEQNTVENEQTGNSLFAIHGFNECYDKISQVTLGNSSGDGNNNAEKCLSLLVFTDIHGDINNIHRIKEFEGCFSTMITDTIQLGDLVRDKIEDFSDLDWAANGMGNVLNVIGNHDAWSNDPEKGVEIATGRYLVDGKGCYDVYIAPFESAWGITLPTGAAANGYCYYYKDYSALNVRIIVLDVMHWDDTQKNWFADTLDDARQNGYSVVGIQHYPAGLHTALDCPFVDPYVSISERTDSHVQVDEFIDNGGEFICWLSGHYHTDLFGLITADERQVELNLDTSGCNNRTHIAKHIKGTLSQDSFNIVSFDTTRKLVRLWRIGRNYDRLARFKEMFCYDYANHVIISK